MAIQQPRVCGEHGARAHGEQFQPARCQIECAQPADELARAVAVHIDGPPRLPHQHHPGRFGQAGRQGLDLADDGAHRAARLALGPDEPQRERLGLAGRAQALVGDAQGLGRAGPIEDQAVRHEHERHLDGRSHGRHVASSAGSSACAGVHRRAKRSFSTVAVRALMLAAGSGVPSGWTMSKVSVASVTKSTV
ncbi:hypothetical protein D9M68_822460 [compost metagenome]